VDLAGHRATPRRAHRPDRPYVAVAFSPDGARLAVGPTRDVVMIDAALERAVDVEDDDALWSAYVQQADWDPRHGSGYRFLVLRPVRIQAWREANEIPGRTLMRDGDWLV